MKYITFGSCGLDSYQSSVTNWCPFMIRLYSASIIASSVNDPIIFHSVPVQVNS